MITDEVEAASAGLPPPAAIAAAGEVGTAAAESGARECGRGQGPSPVLPAPSSEIVPEGDGGEWVSMQDGAARLHTQRRGGRQVQGTRSSGDSWEDDDAADPGDDCWQPGQLGGGASGALAAFGAWAGLLFLVRHMIGRGCASPDTTAP